jgi:hypothetical protein
LIDESTTVGVIGIGLEYTMPVLQGKSVLLPRNLGVRRYPYDRGHQVHGRVIQLIHDIERKAVTLTSAASKMVQRSVLKSLPCFLLSVGRGRHRLQG